MLAQAARQAGYVALVIDLYADQDTEAVAEQVWLVESFALAMVQPIVEQLTTLYAFTSVVYGSGLEGHQETLFWLAENFQLKGNDAVVLQQFADKQQLFKQLDCLHIRYPEVCFAMPKDHSNYLIKPQNNVGGLGISRCRRMAQPGEYYQKFCHGQVGSVLFCVNGGQAQIIGLHRQWTVGQDDFTFAGIVRENILPKHEQQRVQSWLADLVNAYQLQGLGSLDFIWDGNTCYFLEINPRPPASMLLYPELNLFAAHIGAQFVELTTDKNIRALQIIFARKPCKIRQIEWPKWSFDRPKIKTEIAKGEPICSIVAQGITIQQVENSLLAKQQFIENNIY
jgi:methenyltetrahydromethanopterin cyclohydrolase